MKKQAKYLSLAFFALSAFFFGQFLTANAFEPRFNDPLPEPTPICEYNADSIEDGGKFYFAENGECLESPVLANSIDSEVPTSITLVSTNTEINDPVSTVGIVFMFLILVGLTIFWLTTIRKWNKRPNY